ncbi:leucine--tRNA ligase [Candidatus Pacearchaeota archaeon]|nr:leucine--tRNA ligase [Candidatus Pacearchaeota archaeon]
MAKDKNINFQEIEKKWQGEWEKKKAFEVKEKTKSKKGKYYVLEMFPYPSGSGLHMGHAFNYTIGDVYARFMRMQGFNVLYPMGYDSFGLPAENAAIKAKVHPKKFTEQAIKNFISQQKALGLSYDWSRMLKTSDPEYYKWNQYFFLKFLENGLVYRKKAGVNFCRKCNTVLANEQVHNGCCWRHTDTEVEIKQLEQWFIRTTKYAVELLEDIPKLQWPERIKIMQENWIGKSYGTEIFFEINRKKWPIFTTRPDTLFGVTFMVVSAQHQRLMELVTEKQKKEVENFIKKIKSTKQEDMDKLDKEGVFTGSYAVNPLTNEKVPVWAGNFVVADYGSGMVMAVPAHDQRDFDFAKKYKIPIKLVIKPKENDKNRLDEKNLKEAYTGSGILINSKGFNDLDSEEAKKHITKALQFKKLGSKKVQYKLRDWLISRQRYWGTPIPVIYCQKCGIVPVNEKDLPVKLPEKVKFGIGNPLETSKEFVNVKCPKCEGKARRETDTMDTFFDSSWYFLRYEDNKNKKQAFDKKKVDYWMPVDQYIGGAEHAVMHLIYARFFTKALRDLGFFINKDKMNEPFMKLFNQGMLHGNDGAVMSKSRGNVVLPEEVSKKYGIDTARIFLMSIASPDKDTQWSDNGVEGSLRFVKKVIEVISKIKKGKSSARLESKINKTVREITEEIKDFRYNIAIIKLRGLFEYIEHENEISKKDLEGFLKMLSVFAPHIAEELWHEIGNKSFISLAEWPMADKKKIDLTLEKAEENLEKTISDIINILKIIKEKQGKEAEKVYLYVIPNEKSNYNEDVLSKRLNKEIRVFVVNDKNKYDPENKAGKAKLGRPAVFVE